MTSLEAQINAQRKAKVTPFSKRSKDHQRKGQFQEEAHKHAHTRVIEYGSTLLFQQKEETNRAIAARRFEWDRPESQ